MDDSGIARTTRCMRTLELALVRILVVLFGTGSWVAILGIWSETPVLIARGIPEQYAISSYIQVAGQVLPFVGPLAFFLFAHLTSTRIRRPEIPANYVIIGIAVVGTFFLIFYWDSYSVWSVDQQLHSTGFLTLACLCALCDVTSIVTFVGFMSILKPEYLNWYWIGEGLSGMLPALVALLQTTAGPEGTPQVVSVSLLNETVVVNGTMLVKNCTAWEDDEQGNGKPTLFGPEEFFAFLFVMSVLCFVSFAGLNLLPCANREYASISERHYTCGGRCLHPTDSEDHDPDQQLTMSLLGRQDTIYNLPEVPGQPATELSGPATDAGQIIDNGITHLSTAQFVLLYSGISLDYVLQYSVFPAFQSYSAGAYGYMTIAITFPLVEVFREIGFLVFLARPIYSFRLATWTLVSGSIAGCYCFMAAIMSPLPPFNGQVIGNILIVFAWICEVACLNYCKAALYWIIRHGPNSRKHLILTNFVAQAAVLVATLVMFAVVNVLHVFDSDVDGACNNTEVLAL